MTRCYLDHNAAAPMPDEVEAALREALTAAAANPSSAHREGRELRQRIEGARREVAALVGAEPEEVVFTSGGTEGNVAAVWGLWASEGLPGRRRLLVGATEHPAVRSAVEALRSLGAQADVIPVAATGLLDLDALARALSEAGPAIVVVQAANSETGVVQPLSDAARLCREHDALLHCDGVQAAGKVPLTFHDLGVTTLAVAGHKLGAPAGVGALVVARDAQLAALIPGSQEGHRRGGTENFLGIVSMGAAARVAAASLGRWPAVAALRDGLERRLLAAVAASAVLGEGAPRLPNTTCLLLPPPLRGGVVAAALDAAGFAVSAGPACRAGAEGPSPAAVGMGFPEAVARRTLRVSLGLATEAGAVTELVAALEGVVGRATGVRE